MKKGVLVLLALLLIGVAGYFYVARTTPPKAVIEQTIIVSPVAGEGNQCKSKDECKALDCAPYDTPAKNGYKPDCVQNQCKCMCYGCH